jgi:hypothetical protein
MDTPLSGERIAEEKAFARRYLDALAARPVNYAADYAPPLNARPRKVPVVAAPVVAPPDMDVDEEGGAQGECEPTAAAVVGAATHSALPEICRRHC